MPKRRRQLGILKRFLEGFDFVRMKPDNGVIKQVSGNLSARALVDEGRAYGVYVHVPLPKKPKKIGQFLRDHVEASLIVELPAGKYRAEWIDTKTGAVARAEEFQHGGGKRLLKSPAFSNDIALRLVRRGSPPSSR